VVCGKKMRCTFSLSCPLFIESNNVT
jgi:hypothetical protein